MSNTESKQWNGKSRGGRFGYHFFISVIKFLGPGWAYFFLSLIVVYFIPFAPKATAAVWKYNRRRLNYGILRSVKELYLHYYVFGQTIIDKIALSGGLTEKYSFDFDNYERFLEIINGSSGVVLIGAHMGCWEAGSAFFGKYGKKINIVMFDAEHEEIKEELGENRKERDFKIIPVNKDTIAAMLDIKVALNNGEYVCFNGDRYLNKDSSVEKDFMGGKAYFPAGPFLIASKTRVPVVFYYAMREKGRKYRFMFYEASSGGKVTREELMDKYIAVLEDMIGKYPRQWFNFYKFWNN